MWELYEYGEANDEVAAIIRLGHFGAVPSGVRVITQFEEIITVRLSRADIPKIAGAPEVDGMIAGDGYFGPELEAESPDGESLPGTRAVDTDVRRPEDMAMTGRGIVIGVVDWGLGLCPSRFSAQRRHDAHPRLVGPARRQAAVVARAVRLRRGAFPRGDQCRAQDGGPLRDPALPPGRCGYRHRLPWHARNEHRGGDRRGRRPVGRAPEADLVFVHNAPWDGLEDGKLGDS